MVRFGEDLIGGFGPDEWLAAVVPAVDECPDLGRQVTNRDEDAAMDGLLLDDPEPNLRGSSTILRSV